MDSGVIERSLGTAPEGSAVLAALATVLARHGDRPQVLVAVRGGDDDGVRGVPLDLSDEPSFATLSDRAASGLAQPGNGVAEADAILALDGSAPSAQGGALWLALEGSRATLHFDPAVREPRDAEELLGHLESVLVGGAEDPRRTVGELELLSASERRLLLEEWNDTAAPYPARCVHELIAEQVKRTPDRVAVDYEGETLTYAELDERASRLANHLRALGASRDVLVGICVERSIAMVVGLLGILKAGAAYVPIDPAYPSDRQAYMLSDARSPIVLTQSSLEASLPSGDARVLCLDQDWPAIAAELPPSDADPEQLAYVIYTSGSTGKPKGVEIPHRALVNFISTMRERPGLEASDVLCAVTTLSFDIAGLELYLPLLVGARLVIAPRETAGDPRALADLLERSATTVLQATPTTWRMLVDSGWPGRRGLKALCGGEALPVALADELVDRGIELWNMYGPTETTIWSTCARLEGRGTPLTIGRPIANTTLYVLDANLAPVPVGVAGELWIGGDGLARGYRGRPDLTEERFIPHPFDAAPGARIYRTGDLVRYRRDGTIAYLGRIDHQVKIRGFRIELGEIETVLAGHPAVGTAVVVARESPGGEPELAAYVVAAEASVSALELRTHLARSLPAYMVPSTVTMLREVPLTPNGKIDRKALPAPARGRSSEQEPIAPRTPLEERLTRTWKRELEIDEIGVTDNFFDLGVTSVVAARLFAAIEHESANSLPLGAIFRAPTIEALASLIEGGDAAARWTSLVPIQPEGSRQPIFCVHGGGGTVLHIQPLGRRLGSDQPLYGLQSRGLYGSASPLTTVEEMAAHYLSEMRQVQPPGPWYLAGYCFGSLVAFEMACQLIAEGEEVAMLAVFNGPSPSWIKRWGWHGNQPTWRRRRPPRVIPRARDRRRATYAKLRRLLREPRRARSWLSWKLRHRRAGFAISAGRPLPEELREHYFLALHQAAERAYEPASYPGEMLVFHGHGLYEDPELGWSGHPAGGIRSFDVPGEHTNNRQAMAEPAVEFVAARLDDYVRERSGEAIGPGAGDRTN